jgi:hypothetical protein
MAMLDKTGGLLVGSVARRLLAMNTAWWFEGEMVATNKYNPDDVRLQNPYDFSMDLNLIVPHGQVDACKAYLEEVGYGAWTEERVSVHFRNVAGRVIHGYRQVEGEGEAVSFHLLCMSTTETFRSVMRHYHRSVCIRSSSVACVANHGSTQCDLLHSNLLLFPWTGPHQLPHSNRLQPLALSSYSAHHSRPQRRQPLLDRAVQGSMSFDCPQDIHRRVRGGRCVEYQVRDPGFQGQRLRLPAW